MSFERLYCFKPLLFSRLGPLYIEPKKRNIVKRARLDKEKEEEKRPQEVRVSAFDSPARFTHSPSVAH